MVYSVWFGGVLKCRLSKTFARADKERERERRLHAVLPSGVGAAVFCSWLQTGCEGRGETSAKGGGLCGGRRIHVRVI